jgi:hypothetical protein
MGVAATLFRVLANKHQLADYQFQQQMLNQSKFQLQAQLGSLWGITANLEPNSPTMLALNAQIAQIQTIDKGLELQSQRLSTQIQALQAESDGLNKVLEKNISNTFKLLA